MLMRVSSYRVESIPKEWVDQILPLVERGREYKDAVAEVFAINAQLLVLFRKGHRNYSPLPQ